MQATTPSALPPLPPTHTLKHAGYDPERRVISADGKVVHSSASAQNLEAVAGAPRVQAPPPATPPMQSTAAR